jgi:hypothetical protein
MAWWHIQTCLGIVPRLLQAEQYADMREAGHPE